MLIAACHCGAVEIRLADAPTEVADCNCSICRRYGVLWAYVAADRVEVVATRPTDAYAWGPRTQAFHRCAICGCVTHWAKFDPAAGRIGVNARLLPPEALAAARVRRLDGAVTDRYVDP